MSKMNTSADCDRRQMVGNTRGRDLYWGFTIGVFANLATLFLIVQGGDIPQLAMTAAIVGILMGGIQSLSRSTFSKLLPKEIGDNASFFNFYGISYNISVVIGTFSYGYIEQVTGSMRSSVLALTFFFIIGLFFLIRTQIKK